MESNSRNVATSHDCTGTGSCPQNQKPVAKRLITNMNAVVNAGYVVLEEFLSGNVSGKDAGTSARLIYAISKAKEVENMESGIGVPRVNLNR